MENNTDTLHKAIVLMQSALKSYEEGDMGGGERDRAEANKLFDKAYDEHTREDTLYGESRNFGIIYNVIEGNTKNLCEDKSKRKAFGGIVKYIKENKTLKSQFDFFNSLTQPNNITSEDAESYLNEVVGIKPSINIEAAVAANKGLISEIRKNNLFEYVDIDDSMMNLYESIEYILFNKPTFKNVSDYASAKRTVINYLKECANSNNKTETVDVDETLEEMVSKYNDVLTEDEKKLIEQVSTVEDKEIFFNEKKQEVLNVLYETKKKASDKEKINEVIDSIETKQFDEKTLLKDVAEFIEISNIIQAD